MTLRNFHTTITESLAAYYPKEEIQSIFSILLENFTSLKRIDQALQPNKEFTNKEIENLNKALIRLQKNEPIQYIIGETDFYGLPFTVNSSVLIPRPETEELVQWIIDDCISLFQNKDSISILDIGTGSGCIAITLAKQLQNAQVFAIDISSQALEVAKENALKNNVTLQFIEADILNSNSNFWESLFNRHQFDVIVSNPPYVRELEKHLMRPNVLDFEPDTALFVKDDDPLLFYKHINSFARNFLSEQGHLYYEINEHLSEGLSTILINDGFINIQVKKDIFEKDRMIKAVKK